MEKDLVQVCLIYHIFLAFTEYFTKIIPNSTTSYLFFRKYLFKYVSLLNIYKPLFNKLYATIAHQRFSTTFNKVYLNHIRTCNFHSTGWHLEQVDVEDTSSGVKYNFSCDRWLAEDEDDKQIVRELVCSNLPTETFNG